MNVTIEVIEDDLAELGVSAEQLKEAVTRKIVGGLDVDGDTLYINGEGVSVAIHVKFGAKGAYLTMSAVANRTGWTATLVSRLLGDPDKRINKYGRDLGLYAVARVEQAEGEPEFAQAQAAIAKRRLSAAKAVETKKVKLLDAIRTTPITVEKFTQHKLLRRAIDRYNARSHGRSFASLSDDPLFLERITVNFIRHDLTQYDQTLWDAAGKTGIDSAVAALRKRVYEAIAQAYPLLSDECVRQLETRR